MAVKNDQKVFIDKFTDLLVKECTAQNKEVKDAKNVMDFSVI